MNIAQRFTLLVKGHLNAALDALEDPERSLNQLVLDMGEELEAAKRATARAMANEDRLRAQIRLHEKELGEWQAAAERALAKGREADAREALRRRELAERQRAQLAAQLVEQAKETEEVRQSVVQMDRQLDQARRRLELVQAQLRQIEARKAIGRVMQKAHSGGLGGEFERISNRVAVDVAAERAYQKLGDEMSGDALRRRLEDLELDDTVEAQLAALKACAGATETEVTLEIQTEVAAGSAAEGAS